MADLRQRLFWRASVTPNDNASLKRYDRGVVILTHKQIIAAVSLLEPGRQQGNFYDIYCCNLYQQAV